MNFNELPSRIRKTFNPSVVLRTARKVNASGSHLTVVTNSGDRYRYTLVGKTYLPSDHSKRRPDTSPKGGVERLQELDAVKIKDLLCLVVG